MLLTIEHPARIEHPVPHIISKILSAAPSTPAKNSQAWGSVVLGLDFLGTAPGEHYEWDDAFL
ncbi:hypothetical protein C8Q77DRAFT_276743 [Trametes polyzona]|nr:hypothetical protein C8Q77DRAFT_276743 [Trametes polyzona]